MQRLHRECLRIDGRGYKAYKSIAGSYPFDGMALHIDHVQGDPFAAPSRLRIVVPWEVASLPEHARANPDRRRALADFLARSAAAAIGDSRGPRRGSGGSGRIEICPCGQEVLPRSNVEIEGDRIVVRITVGLPAAGRRVLGREAARLLTERIPALVRASLLADAIDRDELRSHLDVVEDQVQLRQLLADRGWVAFVADGSILPRRAGNDDRPMTGAQVVPWTSPPTLAASVDLEHAGRVPGTAIPAGVTLITGGGYHGKSTLLQALLRGVYDHVPGDGRELVATVPDAVAIRAEDGRRVEGVDLRPFIGELPGGRSTARFRTDDASGSTSQAAAICEALETGATALLVDEDTSATNFMVRDRRMQELIGRQREPITPYIARVRELFSEHGVSSLIVVGGVGDYLDVADTVLLLEEYRPRDVGDRAAEIARTTPTDMQSLQVDPSPDLPPRPRRVQRDSLDPRKGRRDRVRARGVRSIQFGHEEIDLTFVEQVVDPAQARFIGDCLLALARGAGRDAETVREICDAVQAAVAAQGVTVVGDFRGGAGDRAWARSHEIAAALNRLRMLETSTPTQRLWPDDRRGLRADDDAGR